MDNSYKKVNITVLQLMKFTIGIDREWIASNYFITLITFAHNLKPAATPSNSASHQATDYLPLRLFCIPLFGKRPLNK